MTIFLVTLAVLLVGIALLSLRILLVPGGEFHGTCSTRKRLAGEEDKGCVCGRKPGAPCPREAAGEAAPTEHHEVKS
jgi:hypothetical protein